jgi:hypothetical protein
MPTRIMGRTQASPMAVRLLPSANLGDVQSVAAGGAERSQGIEVLAACSLPGSGA